MEVSVKQMGRFPIPEYAHEGDGAFDLRSEEAFTLKPFERRTVPCGFAIAIPKGFCGLVIPRSGLASKHGISIVNAPGLVDSGYRGEVKVVLVNLDPSEEFTVEAGDRIAQMAIVPAPGVSLRSCENLGETARGTGGFGSSGIS